MSAPIGPFDRAATGTTAPTGPVADGPPPELMAEIDAGVQRLDRLDALERELNVEVDPISSRVVVEVRDRDGLTLRTLTPSQGLDVMTNL